ncbi:hypothetical protein GSI_11990 [Ganoderma sinense ZZ0214-1]|uniref:Uncharacterized protein n=1 Tax=Ganoderma sinense ZZ0214-1 TaxID=1077348 RepID=A0A2G8RXJ6_9APHY|nr:hypothetical protein GSI_11990 [Ganoderma sinense ZZ0214-1]
MAAVSPMLSPTQAMSGTVSAGNAGTNALDTASATRSTASAETTAEHEVESAIEIDVSRSLVAPPTATGDVIVGRVSEVASNGVVFHQYTVTRDELDFGYVVASTLTITDTFEWTGEPLEVGDVVINTTLARMLTMFQMWHTNDLRELALAHELQLRMRESTLALLGKLHDHSCGRHCPTVVVVFRPLRRPRQALQVERARASYGRTTQPTSHPYTHIASEGLRRTIIREWQDAFSTDQFQINDGLPLKVLPTTYNFAAYERALLNPKGLVDRERVNNVLMCEACYRELVTKNRMPRLSLANWLYYAHEELPADAEVLPPPPEMIRDTVCAVYVAKAKPTKDNIKFHGFSQRNLDGLFGPGTEGQDEGVPCALDIGFIEESVATQSSMSGYTDREPREMDNYPSHKDLLMENVGYTMGDESPHSYHAMKLTALSHCLAKGRVIRSLGGETFLPDFENPSLLTWLFPHLDPWGIGGFHEPGRSVPISMEEQLKYLLELDDCRFERDPDFAFVYYNILQKKALCEST